MINLNKPFLVYYKIYMFLKFFYIIVAISKVFFFVVEEYIFSSQENFKPKILLACYNSSSSNVNFSGISDKFHITHRKASH